MRHQRVKRTDVCKHWLRSQCKKGDMCEYLHQYDMKRMPLCHFFAEGQCTKDDCQFLHIRPEDKVVECPWYRISHAPTYPYTYTYTYTHTYTYTYTGLFQSDVIT